MGGGAKFETFYGFDQAPACVGSYIGKSAFSLAVYETSCGVGEVNGSKTLFSCRECMVCVSLFK